MSESDKQEPKIVEKLELTNDELQNLRTCCVRVAKMPDTKDVEMKYLLNLNDKLACMIV